MKQITFNLNELRWLREALRMYVASDKFDNDPSSVARMGGLITKIAEAGDVTRPSNNPVFMRPRGLERMDINLYGESNAAYGNRPEDRSGLVNVERMTVANIQRQLDEWTERVKGHFVIGDNEWNGMSDAERIHWSQAFTKVVGTGE